MQSQQTLSTLDLSVSNAEQKRQEYKKAFNDSYNLYESLFECVTEEGHY